MTAQKKILDLTGVQYLVQTIKGIVSDINTAISSKANDSEVVHKAQTETVTGEKTFKKDVKIIDLNANERPGVKFEVNGTFRTFEDAKDALPDTDFGDFGVGTVWSAFWLDDNTKIQNSMSDYVINDITFGTTNYSSVIEFNNYYKVKYNDDSGMQTDLRGMLRFELAPYAGVEKDHEYWSNPKLYFYANLENDEFGETILGHEDAHWSKAYIDEINCYEIKFGGNSIHDILEHIVSLSYVTHYSSTSLTSNSTNSLSIIDNQDSVKVNDKVIDSSGKMFYITSVDLRNNEFEVGSVVDTFAKDSAVSTAQATANSARQQAFVFRYSSTALVASSTNSNALLDNTDNLKVGDKVIDSSGVLFSITAIDTQNSTFTIGTALIDLAQDSDVVHKSGNETVNGTKTFKDMILIDGDYLGNEPSNNQRTNICLRANRDTAGKSGAYISRFRQNRAQGALQTGDLQMIGFDVLENEVRTNNVFSIQCSGWVDNVPTKVKLLSTSSDSTFGSSARPSKINDKNPGALSLPDLSNGIDISSYITDLTGASNINKYTPTVNGWVSIGLSNADFIEIYIPSSLMGGTFTKSTINNYSQAFMPVIANKEVRFALKGSSIGWAKFYPCQGNV